MSELEQVLEAIEKVVDAAVTDVDDAKQRIQTEFDRCYDLAKSIQTKAAERGLKIVRKRAARKPKQEFAQAAE